VPLPDLGGAHGRDRDDRSAPDTDTGRSSFE